MYPMVRFVVVSIIYLASSAAYGGDFSCYAGKQGACLDYGDVVCSSQARCVARDAVCFDSYACGFKGFICKSKMDDLVDKCQAIAREHDQLVEQNSKLLREYRTLVERYNALAQYYEQLKACVISAATGLEARACIP